MNVNALQAGQIFAFPLNIASYFGACRIVRLDRGGGVLAALSWLGETRPTLEQVHECALAYDNHGPFEGNPMLYWGAQAPPSGFEYIGLSTPGSVELELTTCHCKGRVCLCKRRQGGWKACRASLVRYWQWKLDRESYEEQRAAIRQEFARISAQQQRAPAPRSLAEFRQMTLFAGWEGYLAPYLIETCRRILHETVDQLAGLSQAENDARLAIMQACIEQFNALNAQHTFIETLEREDICEVFGHLARLLGLDADLADRWREW